MGTYKVIQDIEAEDKLLGPLSLRQFIYAIIMLAIGFVGFTVAKINPLLAIPFLFPMGLFGLLAAPFGRDQSSEVWLLAKIRFAFKPRRRIWDQTGVKDYVTITVPKQIERHLTDGLDQTQVKSRLKALAETLDSRGWAVKNATATAGVFVPPAYVGGYGTTQSATESDRLVGASTLPATPIIASDVTSADDVLDEHYNPTAQKLGAMIEQSEQTRRQNLINTMQQPVAQQQAAPVIQQPQQPVQAIPTTTAVDESALLDQIHQKQAADRASNSHTKRIATPEEIAATEQAAAQTKARADELKRLATNDDLNIATIARQAHKDDSSHELGSDEVVISLH